MEIDNIPSNKSHHRAIEIRLLTEDYINLYYEYAEILKQIKKDNQSVKYVFFIYSSNMFIQDNYRNLVNIYEEERYMYTTYYNGLNYELRLNINNDNYIYIMLTDGTLYSFRFDVLLRTNPNIYKYMDLINQFIKSINSFTKNNVDIINIKMNEICDNIIWDSITYPKYTSCNICQTFMTVCLYVHDKNICLSCINPDQTTLPIIPISFIYCNICHSIHICNKKSLSIENMCQYCNVANCKIVLSTTQSYCGNCSGLF